MKFQVFIHLVDIAKNVADNSRNNSLDFWVDNNSLKVHSTMSNSTEKVGFNGYKYWRLQYVAMPANAATYEQHNIHSFIEGDIGCRSIIVWCSKWQCFAADPIGLVNRRTYPFNHTFLHAGCDLPTWTS